MTAEILVYSENDANLKELLGKARQAAGEAGWKVSTVVFGPDSAAGEYGAAGADVVYQLDLTPAQANRPEIVVAALTEIVRQAQPGLVLFGATKFGLEVAPRVAERTQSSYAAWAVDFEIDKGSGAVAAQCMLYSGMGRATYQFVSDRTVILSSAQGVFAQQAAPEHAVEARTVSFSPAPTQVEIIEKRAKSGGGTRLEEANLVVDVGQGVKEKTDLEMIRSLADLLDGQVACSRPVSSERDWFPEWLGLSGMKISPELCLTVGVSGQIQHIVGIRDSRLIAAVNNDENAAIFTQADFGVVADLYEFLPVFIERVKARGIKPGWLA